MERLRELTERHARLLQRCETERAAAAAEAAALRAVAGRIDHGVHRLRRLPLVAVLALAVAAAGIGGILVRRRRRRMRGAGFGLGLLAAALQAIRLAGRLRRRAGALVRRPS
jgi:hypothetical protein